MLVNLVIGRRMVLQCVPYALLGLFLIALDWQIAHNASTRGQLKLRALLMSRSVKVSENSFVKKLQTINTFFYECSLHFSFRFFFIRIWPLVNGQNEHSLYTVPYPNVLQLFFNIFVVSKRQLFRNIHYFYKKWPKRVGNWNLD